MDLPTDTASADRRRAFARLAAEVCAVVPGCRHASVTLVHEGLAATLVVTHTAVQAVDQQQYDVGAGPCLEAIAAGRPVGVDDYIADARWPHVSEAVLDAGLRSSVSLPLLHGDEALGALNLYGDEVGAFPDESRRAAGAFARQAVEILGYLSELQRERAARLREYEVAATLQRSLLPSLPRLPGLTSAARYVASDRHAAVGGDWYDLFALPDGAVGIAVGDVMGHDVIAAAAMGQLRSVLRSYAYEGTTPSVVLERMDRLVQGFDMAQLATAVYGRLVRQGDISRWLFANAGHVPPLISRPDGSVHRLDRGVSALIGALAPGEAPRTEGVADLPVGSLLVLYTDGLVERRGRDLDDGIDALCATLADLGPGRNPDEVCDVLLDRLVTPEHDDDIALLVVRVEPRA